MSYKLSLIKDAKKDYLRLDGSQRIVVDKALTKILTNPLPNTEGGYGKPLSNLSDSNLAGLLKVKLKSPGIRIVYKLEKINDKVVVIVIGMRDDSKVYKEAARRLRQL